MMFKAMLELDFNFCIEFTIEIPDRALYLAMTIEIDVQSYVGTGF